MNRNSVRASTRCALLIAAGLLAGATGAATGAWAAPSSSGGNNENGGAAGTPQTGDQTPGQEPQGPRSTASAPTPADPVTTTPPEVVVPNGNQASPTAPAHGPAGGSPPAPSSSQSK